MSVTQLLKAHYDNKNRPVLPRQIVLPGIGTGIGATITAANNPLLGTWIDVALIAAVTEDTLIVGVLLETPSAGAIFSIDIGCTLSGGVIYANAAAVNAVPAAIITAHRAWIRLEVATDAGPIDPVMLEFPVFIPNATGILARGYTVGGGETANISVLCVQGWE